MKTVGACLLPERRKSPVAPVRLGSLVLALGLVLVPASRADGPALVVERQVHLDPTQFNLEGLSPGPARDANGRFLNAVFSGPAQNGPEALVTICRYTDGSMTVTTPARTEGRTVLRAAATGLEKGTTTTVVGRASMPAPTASAARSEPAPATRTIGRPFAEEVVNSLTFRVEGNLLIAVVIYTVGTVRTTEEVSLGVVDLETGAFTAFSDGLLEGKKIEAAPAGESVMPRVVFERPRDDQPAPAASPQGK